VSDVKAVAEEIRAGFGVQSIDVVYDFPYVCAASADEMGALAVEHILEADFDAGSLCRGDQLAVEGEVQFDFFLFAAGERDGMNHQSGASQIGGGIQTTLGEIKKVVVGFVLSFHPDGERAVHLGKCYAVFRGFLLQRSKIREKFLYGTIKKFRAGAFENVPDGNEIVDVIVHGFDAASAEKSHTFGGTGFLEKSAGLNAELKHIGSPFFDLGGYCITGKCRMQVEKTDFVGFVHYFGVLTKNEAA
jgi:hypothetical protein